MEKVFVKPCGRATEINSVATDGSCDDCPRFVDCASGEVDKNEVVKMVYTKTEYQKIQKAILDMNRKNKKKRTHLCCGGEVDESGYCHRCHIIVDGKI